MDHEKRIAALTFRDRRKDGINISREEQLYLIVAADYATYPSSTKSSGWPCIVRFCGAIASLGGLLLGTDMCFADDGLWKEEQ